MHMFKAVGTAPEDFAAALLVYERAAKTTNHDKGI
jgi:ornithine cyclodeaminase/alanine dehydrogenase-like protein (mu-crystallin family)